MADGNLNPEKLIELLVTRARTNFAAFVTATHRPRFKHSEFSRRTCAAVDKFVDDLVAGKRPVLVLTAPPQHGKSSLISRCLPPYLIGRLGKEIGTARIALASYALSRAKANGRDAKNIMLEPIYRAIFEHASLVGFKGDINTSDRYSVPNGQVLATGVGGGMTGFSVDCFAGHTLVSTDRGPVRIDQLHVNAETTKLLCHDGTTLRYARIKAIAHRQAARLYRITTDADRVLEVTGNHPIYSAGAWRPAAELAPGDVLLCAVSIHEDCDRGGLREAAGSKFDRRSVLQSSVLRRRTASGQNIPDMSGLRESYGRLRARSVQTLPPGLFAGQEPPGRSAPNNSLRALWRNLCVRVESWIPELLREVLCGRRACRPNVGPGKSKLARRESEVDSANQAARTSHVPVCEAGDVGSRPIHVSALRADEQSGSASHRREPVSQFVLEFVDPVQDVPPVSAPRAYDARAEEDRVRSVEIVDGPVRVFDVQVETHACLFAGGILAHNCMLIDDAIKDAVEALSPTNQEKLENWFDSVVTTRLQERSGQIIIGTPWSSNDLLAFVHNKFKDDPNYTRLQFVALNEPDQVGFQEDQPRGPLVPELQSEEKLRAVQAHMGAQWWAAMYQQAPLGSLGAIFGPEGTRFYRRADLPKTFVRVVMSVDAAFKDKKSSDYVAAGVWGKTADGRVWLLEMRRERLSFTRTAAAIAGLKAAYPHAAKVLIEDAANGPALIDQLSKSITGITGVPTTGSKESRAHAVSWVWENGLVMLPHPDDVPMIKPVVAEITSFPDTRNDDAVDCMVIALQHLCLRDPISSLVTPEMLLSLSHNR